MKEKYCTECGYVSKTTIISRPKTITLSTISYTYDRKVKKTSVQVKDSVGKILEKDVDYTLKYASVRKSTGKYSGKKNIVL